MSVWSIVVAAGSGTRFGGTKQLEMLGGRRVLDWSVAAAEQVSDGVVLVVAAEHQAEIEASFGCSRSVPAVVPGGATRAASVRCGLAAVPQSAEIIVVHDAARPLASPALFTAVIDAVRDGADGAVPGVALVDTIRRVGGGVVDRDELVAVQTPQAFRAAVLRAAHRDEQDATDDASLVERAGGKVVVVPGDLVNRKITTPVDLVIAQALLDEGRPR
ncbi:MAG TPA: 2-C-methyl-D-erythritol 4-phosphate cytidylyltransferase [Acidimicrobiales bacterium]